MKAYTCGITKQQFIDEIKLHMKLDNFQQRFYQENGKGCAVGCAIASINKLKNVAEEYNNHSCYELHLGIPEWLAKLENSIFEGLAIEDAKEWPLQFSTAINEGADLNAIKLPFLVYVLETNIANQTANYSQCIDDKIKQIIKQVIAVNEQMIAALKSNDEQQIKAAESAAWSARSAVRAAAESARSAARSAVRAAAWSAEWSAAWSAAWSAESAEWSAARAAAFKKFANKLIKLLKECK